MVKIPKRKPSQGVVVPPVFKTTLAFLQFISPYLGMRWAAYFFGRPKRYKLQPREISVFNKSRRFLLEIEPLKKKIMCYHWEGSGPKVLLVHGWSGRAVNFCKIIEKLMEHHCDLYAFDAPAHGMSEGTTTNLPQFIACIDALVDDLDSIDCILGHSGGGFAAAYHATHHPQLKKLIIISSFDAVLDVFQNFSQWVQLVVVVLTLILLVTHHLCRMVLMLLQLLTPLVVVKQMVRHLKSKNYNPSLNQKKVKRVLMPRLL